MRLATLRAGGLAALQEIMDHNLLLLTEILEWSRAQGIAMFRISSDLVPFVSHDAVDLAQVRFDLELLARIMDATAGVRLSMHPGQFTVLSTADQDVLQRSVAELRYHAAILARLGLGGDLVLHGGGVYGDRPAAAERLVRNIRALLDAVRESICLEGDERAWSVEQLLPICEEAGVPLIVDTLHHTFNGETSLDQLPWSRIRNTWADRKPKIHYSEQDRVTVRLPSNASSLLRSSVVTWWHSATLSCARPPIPTASGTAVGPRRAWERELETGTTITASHSTRQVRQTCGLEVGIEIVRCASHGLCIVQDSLVYARLPPRLQPEGDSLARKGVRGPAGILGLRLEGAIEIGRQRHVDGFAGARRQVRCVALDMTPFLPSPYHISGPVR